MSSVIDFLGQIQWSCRYGVFQGTIVDSDILDNWIGNDNSGTVEVVSPTASGSQETKMSWYRDEGVIKFRILSVTEPK